MINARWELSVIVRRSHWRCSVKKGALRNFAKLTGKHLCQRLFFNRVAGRLAILLKKSLWHRYFPVNFTKFLRTPFLQNTSGRLLLYCGHAELKYTGRQNIIWITQSSLQHGFYFLLAQNINWKINHKKRKKVLL